MGTVADYLKTRKKKNPDLLLGSLHDISAAQKYPPIPTGNPVFDYVTSVGGIPRGVITEVRGFESAGKSTIAAMAAAQHQQAVKRGEAKGAILYLDFEYAVRDEYFASLGIDAEDEDSFIYMQPETLEEGMNEFLAMTKAGLLAMGIIDSVAAASSEAEHEKEIGKMSVGLRARGFSQAFRMCVGPMRRTGTALVLINHQQMSIPTGYGEISRKISPGGKAIDYYTSLRVELERPKLNKEDSYDELTNAKTKQVTSTEVVATAFKNKVGEPHRSGKMQIEFGKGFDSTYSSLNILVDHKIIKKKSGGHFEFPSQLVPEGDISIPQGENNVVALIKSIPEWNDKINQMARSLVLSKQTDQILEPIVVTDDLIDEETGEILAEAE